MWRYYEKNLIAVLQGGLLQLYARQSKGRFRVVEDGTLYITDTQTSDDGEYKCTATNSAGSNSSTASLRVRGMCWLRLRNLQSKTFICNYHI